MWIVFNGEIYNHAAVRRDLESRGHHFRTSSDTEVIVHAYEEYGDGCVEQLEGMFAFAIYDQRARACCSARDRLGKKPLFYAIFGGVLHFASEIKALKASPFVGRRRSNLAALEGYLSLGYFLAPAHGLSARPQARARPLAARRRHADVEIRKYWDVERFDTMPRPEAEVLDGVDARLPQAVQRRLESEVPIGAFLSGGIDSGLVVSYMAEALVRRQSPTSVGFGDAAHNELEAAGLTAAHLRHAALYRGDRQPQLEEVLDPNRARVRRAVCRFLGDSDLLCLQDGAAARDGGAERRRRRRDVRRIRLPLRAARSRRAGPARRAAGRWQRARRGSARDGRDRAALPRPLRLGNVLENLGRDPAAAYYADLCFLKPRDARALLGRRRRAIPHDSPVYRQVTEPTASARRRAPCSARSTPTSRSTCRTICW